MFKPERDGVDHINIYSQANTILGVFLSNWYKYPVILDDLGRFDSIEGLWYFLKTGDERLRSMSGYACKQLGSSLPIVNKLEELVFQEIITRAIRKKILTSSFYFPFINSTLPFTHYYVFNGKQVDAGNKWIVDFISNLRDEVKADLNKGGIKFAT